MYVRTAYVACNQRAHSTMQEGGMSGKEVLGNCCQPLLLLSVQSLGPELSKRDAAIARLQQALKEKEAQIGQQDQQLLDLSTRKAAEVGVLEKALADLRGVVEQQAGEGEG